MSDGELKGLVEAALAERANLTGANVGAEVFDGRVILVGDVDTLGQETEALLAAKGVPGVKEVLSALRLAEMEAEGPQEIDDTTLKSQVEAALREHGIVIEGEGVVVTGGDVFLRGQIDLPRQRIQAERLATTVKGIRGVHNELGDRG